MAPTIMSQASSPLKKEAIDDLSNVSSPVLSVLSASMTAAELQEMKKVVVQTVCSFEFIMERERTRQVLKHP